MIENCVHKTVMLEETIKNLNIKDSGIYVDATFGRGGHSQEILSKLGPNGKLIVIDKDPEAIAVAMKLAANDDRVKVFSGSFANIQNYCDIAGYKKIDGILFDLGVSSPQLDTPDRGFSFRFDAELDMRMDPESGISAKQWLAEVELHELIRVFREYANEPFAKKMAKLIVNTRGSNPITTTKELADLIVAHYPKRYQKIHPATRIFQAIRIAVNSELSDLRQALAVLPAILSDAARVAVISFHSAEHRIVKQEFSKHANTEDDVPLRLKCLDEKKYYPAMQIIMKLEAQDAEQESNRRSRSAILRVAEKLKVPQMEESYAF